MVDIKIQMKIVNYKQKTDEMQIKHFFTYSTGQTIVK